MVTKNVLGWGPDLSGSCASLQWRWHVLVSAGSHTGWLGKDLWGKHTRALFLWYHWTHTHILYSVRVSRHTHTHISTGRHTDCCCWPPAVVAELDDVVLVAVPLGVHYQTEECLLLLLSIDLHPPPEEPVTTVLAGTAGDRVNSREWKTREYIK